MKKRRIPQRMCIACRERMEKRDLIRIVKTPDEEILVDLTGKKAGRGAYLCGKLECLEKAIKTKGLERALNCSITAEVIENLRKHDFNE